MGFNPRIKNLDNNIIQLSGSAVTGTNSQFTTVTASILSASSLVGPAYNALQQQISNTISPTYASSLKIINTSSYNLSSSDDVIIFTGSATVNILPDMLPNLRYPKKITVGNLNSSNITLQYPRDQHDNSTNTVTQQGSGGTVFISASDRVAAVAFGNSTAMNAAGNRIVVGAYNAEIGALTDPGKAYVYVSQSTGWIQQGAGGNPFISASDKMSADEFGISVAMNAAGDRIVIGSHQADPGAINLAGKAYVYVSQSTGWIQQGAGGNPFISASDKAANDYFGYSVGINAVGDRIVVGAYGADISVGEVGKVYVYVSQSTGWIQQGAGGNPFISASDKVASDQFGQSVAMNAAGDRIVVGAYYANPGSIADAGKVYVYVSQSTGWIQQGAGGNPFISASDKATSDYFGASVAINAAGDRIAVGAFGAAPGTIADAGKVYVYVSQSTGWIQQGAGGNPFISASDKVSLDYFGYSVAMNAAGDRIVVGAYGADPGTISSAGKTYVYSSGSSGWIEQIAGANQFISASDKAASAFFGRSVSINTAGDRIVVGAEGAAGGGKAYVYQVGTTSSLPYFSGAYDTWPNGFQYSLNKSTTQDPHTSTFDLVSDGTSSWFAG